MVRSAVDSQGCSVELADDAAEVGVQVRFQIGGDERLPILGAEDDVSDVLMEGTGHGGAMVENRGEWSNENAMVSAAPPGARFPVADLPLAHASG